MKKRSISIKGLQIHVSHYDPSWCQKKSLEEPFDVEVALRLIDAMSDQGMNVLVVDCADGVHYKSHPELARFYTVPMDALERLSLHAEDRGIDVVPKLNFAKSGRTQHDQWLSPHSKQISWTDNYDKYWQVADDLIEELVAVCKPKAFFHVGMDEDHYRSLTQYCEAIEILRGHVSKHNLRTIVWNDSCHFGDRAINQVHADKCRAAEEHISTDIVHVLWDYSRAHPEIVKRLVQRGFSVWGAPGLTSGLVQDWRNAIIDNGGDGLLMTKWVKCCKTNEAQLLAMIEELAPLY